MMATGGWLQETKRKNMQKQMALFYLLASLPRKTRRHAAIDRHNEPASTEHTVVSLLPAEGFSSSVRDAFPCVHRFVLPPPAHSLRSYEEIQMTDRLNTSANHADSEDQS